MPNGDTRRVITSFRQHETYDDALRHLQSLDSAFARIVSDDPLMSPVPLAALPQFRRVHASRQPAAERLLHPIPDVQVYEVVGDE